MLRFLPRIVGAALLSLVGAAPLQSVGAADIAGSPAKTHIKFGVSAGINTAAQPALYAKSSGIFEKHGIDAEIVNMHDDTTAMQGLIAGAYDMLYVGASPGMIAISRGADIKIVSSFTPASDFLFVTQKNIGSLKEMEGQTLGVSKVGSLSYLAALFALRREGVDIKKITIIAAGNDPDRAKMMIVGRIAGGVLNGINAAQALSAGPNLHVVYDVGSAFRDSLLGTAVFARGSVITDQAAAVENVVAALMESSRALQANKELAIGQAISTGLPPEAVKTTYDRLYALPVPYYGVNGGIRRDVVESSVKLLKEDGDIDTAPEYSKVVDEQFIQAAIKELGPYNQ